MLYWTLRSLFAEKVGLVAASVGVMLALVLALYLDAVFRGEARQLVVFIERMPGAVWVLQDGVQNLHMASTSLSDDTIAEVRRVPGVRTATPVIYGAASVGDPAHERVAYVVGVPADPVLRQHWEEVTGWPMPEGEGIVVPKPIAEDLGLQPGDSIRVGDAMHRIAALARGTFSMANPLVFMDERHARSVLSVVDGASFVLIEPEAGLSGAALAQRINATSENVRATTREALRQNDYILAIQMAGALLRILTIAATIVSALIVAFAAYAFVSARTGELAVAKALGAPQHQLLSSALLQTSIVAVLGSLLAMAIIGPMGAALSRLVPQVAVVFSLTTALGLSAVMLLVAIAAALVPIFYVLRVDPALVFKG